MNRPPLSPLRPVRPLRPFRSCAAGVRGFDHAKARCENAWEFAWSFTREDEAFAGHFPHQPVLAGVLLVEMAQRAAEFALANGRSEVRRVVSVDRVRFLQPILPGDDCVLHLEWALGAQAGDPLPVALTFSKTGGRATRDTPAAEGQAKEDRTKVAQGQLTFGPAQEVEGNDHAA